MTPQGTFMVVAPVSPSREAELRGLLASMNDAPGRLKADTPLVPFARFDALHVARLLLVDDKTVEDVRIYGIPPRAHPLALAFLGDLDGDPDDFLRELARRAPEGLRALFSCCEGFRAEGDLFEWMREHSAPAAAGYVNWRGRTVERIREEAALGDALERHIETGAPALKGLGAPEVHANLRRLVRADVAAGRLTLSAERPTPLGWRLSNLLHLLGVPLLLILASPVLIVVGAILLVRLRRLEKSDPELCPRTDPAAAAALAAWRITT